MIEILFTEEWSTSLLQILTAVYLNISSIKIAKKKIIFEVIKLFNSPFQKYETLQVYAEKLFYSFSKEDSFLVKIHKKKIVRPIACYQTRNLLADALRCHNLIFSWYRELK